MATMLDIEQKTKEYSAAREMVSVIVAEIEAETASIKRRYLARLKKAVQVMAERQAEVKALIEGSPALFEKPRTRVLHGIKVGLQKQKGQITWADEDQVVRLIHKHCPDQVDILIKTTERPVKDALQQLTAAELKKIGVTVTQDGDAVVIKGTDSEIDKFVAALLKDEEEANARQVA